jgi:aminopeptidase N
MNVVRNGDHLSALILDGEKLLLKSIAINGEELDPSEYVVTDESLTVTTSLTQFELTIETEINPLENTSLEGLFKSGDAFCTQCEAEGFRRITYYLDRPDVMAKFSCTIIADETKYPFLLSNGNKTDEGKLENGKHFVSWQDPFPKPCYLFALVAGNFDVLTDRYVTSEGRNVALEIFVDPGNLAKAHHAMASLKKAMKWDEDTFGLAYDLDIYMIVAVDFFNMGAMENKGLNVFNSKYVLADEQSATDTDYFNIEAVIAHEYFHNWTGNRVTCRDWFQLSLKEGLTVFRDQQFSADMHSAAVCRIQNVRVLRSMQFAEDAGPMAHPIRPEKVMEMNNFYTLTVYEKGAEVIRMIHTLLGVDKFRLGMDLYFKRFDGMAVTCDDFVDAMADASGVDLSMFKRWYSQSGTPILRVNTVYDSTNKSLAVTLEQQHEPSKNQPEKLDLHIPVLIEIILPTGESKTQLLQLMQAKQTWHFDNINELPVLSVLGKFSAPVKLDFEQSDQALQTIMLYAKDDFSRWDAGQQLFVRYIKNLVEDQQFVLPQNLLTTFVNVINNEDKSLVAEQLTLPSFDAIIELYDEVDPTLIVAAIDKLKQFLAQGMQQQLLEVYTANKSTSYSQLPEDTAARKLKNCCLSYLAILPETKALIAQQFEQSDNMTDTLAAMKSASLNNLAEFEREMTLFAQRWANTSLEMDKWFSLAASVEREDMFDYLQTLLEHPEFSLKNPNRARSVIGAFAQTNPKYFHHASGAGYQFLAQAIAKLNTINPQVASRMLTPLIQFKRLDSQRKQLIISELEKLSALDDLSKDLQEKLSAALA